VLPQTQFITLVESALAINIEFHAPRISCQDANANERLGAVVHTEFADSDLLGIRDGGAERSFKPMPELVRLIGWNGGYPPLRRPTCGT